MKDKSLRVLMVEDSEEDALLTIRELKKGGYNPVYERVETAAAMKKALQDKQWDIILCDYSMPKFNAPSAIAVLKKANIGIPIIIVSGTISEDVAVECMLLGAHDYIMKDNLSRLCPAIARELKDADLKTRQKDTDEKLRREEQRFRALIEHSSDIIVLLNLEGIITYINPAVERVLGFKPEERIGAKGFELVHPDDIKFLVNSFNTLARNTNSPIIQGEMHLRHKDGSWRTLDAVGSNMVNNNVVEAIIVNYRDITERKRMEEKLRDEEQRFRTFVENSSDIIAILNREGMITYENQALERSLGLKIEERIGGSIFDRIHPDDLKFASDAFNEFILNTSSQHINSPVRHIRLRHQDGSWRTFETSASKLLYDNIVETVIINLRDITERKLAEEAQRESEERLRSMIQSLSDIIFILDVNGQLSYESPSATRILGYQPGYFIGKSPFIHIYPDDLDRVTKDLDEVFLSVNPGIPTEFRYRKADDTWIYLEALGSNQFKNHGIQGIVLTVRDITERKKAEEKLQKTLESLRKAVGTTVQVLVSAVESRDSYTAGHQSRSADLACAIATEMGLAQEKVEGILMAGIIHDIGKLSIPAEILSKPTKLTEIEFSLIKEHARSGYEMLKDVESPWPLAEIVYQHHERMNGSGYPRNLKGDEILMESQILAVADVVEAMASHRPYRPTLGIKAALEEIEKNRGILYDNAVADACLKLFREKGYQLK